MGQPFGFMASTAVLRETMSRETGERPQQAWKVMGGWEYKGWLGPDRSAREEDVRFELRSWLMTGTFHGKSGVIVEHVKGFWEGNRRLASGT